MPGLPQSRDDEFRPFERKLPEFKFWWSFTRATLLAFLASFFSAFDVSRMIWFCLLSSLSLSWPSHLIHSLTPCFFLIRSLYIGLFCWFISSSFWYWRWRKRLLSGSSWVTFRGQEERRHINNRAKVGLVDARRRLGRKESRPSSRGWLAAVW